jgi:CheY-like chemotaxis protein
MYNTIENPDVKMINQLLRNQELVENQMEDKSRFLFEMSQDIKQPTNNILGLVNNYDNLNNEDKKDAIKIIGDNANELLFKLNNVLNVSSMDASKIKIVKEEYNPKILLNGIKSMGANAIGEKPIKLNFEVSEALPDKLSGDDVRLKQIIMSIIYNCVNHTESGVINVNVDSIVRYDVARLMIKIEDTGIGMDLDTINRVLDDNQELDKVDIEKLDRLDVDLKVVVKIVKLLGGNFMIKSDKGRGSIFTIVLDQKCEMENLANSKELEKYTSDAFGKKRVLVVDDSKEELFKISDILGKKDININTSMMGKECVDRIRSGEIYNLIIIDDELKITSGYNVLKELNSLEKFKIPVIIMLEKDKEYLKKHYIEDGFKDVILKEYLNDELERISNSYL